MYPFFCGVFIIGWGIVVAALQVFPGDEVMLMSDKGTLVRTRVDEIRIAGRNSQGVRLIRLEDGERLVGLQRIQEVSVADDESISDSANDSAPESSEEISE